MKKGEAVDGEQKAKGERRKTKDEMGKGKGRRRKQAEGKR
jgi:hypothetical protein